MSTINHDSMGEVEASLKEDEKRKSNVAYLKRYFFTLAANVKKILGAKHQGYYVSTLKMFGHVMQKQLPVDDWPKFVMEEMSQRPQNWKDEKKVRIVNQLYADGKHVVDCS